MKKRSVFTRVLLYFLMLMFLVITNGCDTIDDEYWDELNSGSHLDDFDSNTVEASGTYTYSNGILTMNWESSDFPCNGPEVGTETNTGAVTITATTMEWTHGNAIWTRESGTEGDPIGEWEALSDGNKYELNINGDGTVSVSSNLEYCEDDNDTEDDATPWQH